MLAVASSKCRSYRAQGVHPKTLLTFLDVLKYSKWRFRSKMPITYIQEKNWKDRNQKWTLYGELWVILFTFFCNFQSGLVNRYVSNKRRKETTGGEWVWASERTPPLPPPSQGPAFVGGMGWQMPAPFQNESKKKIKWKENCKVLYE